MFSLQIGAKDKRGSFTKIDHRQIEVRHDFGFAIFAPDLFDCFTLRDYCQTLAQAAGANAAGVKTWRAYLSTQAVDGQPAVNARDRIGKGPWQNSKGVER